MKHLLLTTIAAVVLVGCATPTQPSNSPLFDAVKKGDIEAVKKHLDAGADVNARIRFKPGGLSILKMNARLDRAILGLDYKVTPLDLAISRKIPQHADYIQGTRIDHPEIANLLRKHGGKTSVELDNPFVPLFNALEKATGN
jgi:hypothetical protein